MICAVVLNWNGAEETIACLQSLFEISDKRLSTIVVCDNGSSDDSIGRIRSWAYRTIGHPIRGILSSEVNDDQFLLHESIVIIDNQANGGYAAGCNPGIRYALKRDFKFIWILNNDTRFHPDAVTALMDYAQTHPDTGVIGSTLVDFDHRDRVQCTGGCYYYPLTTVFTYAGRGRLLSEALSVPLDKELDYVYGASLFVRADVFRRIGLLNEAYFLFYEELDFCHRVRSAGYRLGWCSRSIVFHRQSGSFENMGATMRQERITNYHENLSTLIFTATFHPSIFYIACLLRFVGKSIKMVIYGKWYLLHPLCSAYADYFCRKKMAKRPFSVA